MYVSNKTSIYHTKNSKHNLEMQNFLYVILNQGLLSHKLVLLCSRQRSVEVEMCLQATLHLTIQLMNGLKPKQIASSHTIPAGQTLENTVLEGIQSLQYC